MGRAILGQPLTAKSFAAERERRKEKRQDRRPPRCHAHLLRQRVSFTGAAMASNNPMHPWSHAGRLGVQLLWLAAELGCRGPEGGVGIASSPKHATPPASADAPFDPSVHDAQPEAESKPASPASGDDSQPTCPMYVSAPESSSGIMLEVDGPVWGVRELWLSSSGNFRYRSGEAGKNADVFGLPNQQCDSQVNPEEVTALIDHLDASGACNASESEDAAPASARTLSVCMAPVKSRCFWSAGLIKPPVWMTTISRFVRTACERTGATHPSPGAP